MAGGFCLIGEKADSFKKAILSGEINPEKLANMESADRRAFLEKYVGKAESQAVNANFESKLLLKNQKAGITTWAKQLVGVKPEVKQDLISRINKMDTVLDPGEKQQFLADLAAHKLGVNVTQEEAKTIMNLSKKVQDAEALPRSTKDTVLKGGWKPTANDLNYGRAHYDMADHIQGLKDQANKFKVSDFYKHPASTFGKAAGLTRSLVTIGDLSIGLRNGFKLMATHPTIWAKDFSKGFVHMFKAFGDKNAFREVQAYVRSSPFYNDMVKANLLPKAEEAFPVSIPGKIPVLGRVARATEVGYEAISQYMRVDTYHKVISDAEKAGVDITSKNFKTSLGKFVGMLTNRGSIGPLERSGNAINNVLFSPRALAASLHLVTDWARKDYDPYIRKQATKSLFQVAGTIAGIWSVANALQPGSVELDPRSSNFGKIKVGDTSFDVTGGMGSLAVLAGRLFTQQSKSTTTGKVSQLNSGTFGGQTMLDVVTNFLENKSAPALGIIINQLRGTNAVGEKNTLGSQVSQAVTPLGIQTLEGALANKNPNNPDPYITMLLDDIGITAQTGKANGSNGGENSWDTNTTKTVDQFKSKVSNSTFEKAGQQYDMKLSDFLNKIKGSSQYNNMSSNDQQAYITKEKTALEKKVMANSGFKYKAAPPNKNKYNGLPTV